MNEAWIWVAWGGMAMFVGAYGWGWRRCGERGRAWLEWGLIVLVAGVSAASAATHEPWRDELHSWLQAREMGLGALWKEMAYEGHFLPWYLLLWPLAHFGAPVWTMGAVSWALNAVAVWMLARKSPLTGWEKAAAGVSCLFLYVNPVVSRCYVLVPLALFGAASLWGRRDERPVAFGLWVALLANTHVYLEGAAAALFGVFAWENVLRRADGKGGRECGRQWAGLAVMAAGGALAAAQVLPSLWESAVGLGGSCGWQTSTIRFLSACASPAFMVAVAAGVAGLAALAWRKDKGVFAVQAAGLAYMWGFAVFLYHADVVNRALLWWPLSLFAAWALSARGRGGRGRVAAVVAIGLGLVRPDMTWRDWREDYDVLPGVCRRITERFGLGAEVWIDYTSEPAAAYLKNAMDWTTGKKAGPVSWKPGQIPWGEPFRGCRAEIFSNDPGRESFLGVATLVDWGGVARDDLEAPGTEVLEAAISGIHVGGVVAFRSWRWGREWIPTGMVRLRAGDREGAAAAWRRTVAEDGGAWEAMNNLAWVALEEGRVEEARGWIDRAMVFEEARGNAAVRDTEADVRRAEGAGGTAAARQNTDGRKRGNE